MSVAVVADKYLATGFEFAGATPFIAETEKEAELALDEAVKGGYKLVIVAERFAEKAQAVLNRLTAEKRPFPVIVIVPDLGGKPGARIERLRQLVSQAVGARLKLEV